MLAGLIGAGIGQSLTPAMQMAEASHHGLRMHYQLIDLDVAGRTAADLPMLLDAAQAMGFAGLNITYPCKQAAVALLDELSPQARAMGAVNTVIFRDGRKSGHNTDGPGWSWGFQRAMPQADLSRVVLLGAGGAGSAIAHAVMEMGVQTLCIVDVDAQRAAALADSVNGRYAGKAIALPSTEAALQSATGLIHATPTGTAKMPGLPLPAPLLRPSLWVSEVVYFPMETELIKAARAQGCAVVDGGAMAVARG